MKQRLPIIATLVVGIVLYVAAGLRFDGFFSVRVLFNLLSDNAFLGVIAVGLTFVILSGGIDLSVGAMVGCSGIMVAWLITKSGLHPALAALIVLGFGSLIGLALGLLIQHFKLPPFLVTLGGLFFCRGLALMISRESMQIDHPLFSSISQFSISLPGKASLPVSSIIWLALFGMGIYLAKQTRFGRTTYAIGGNESSAMLMGLPVAKTKILIYTFSGFCGALGGLVFSLYTGSGNALSGTALELDAIAAVAVGGTPLSGGRATILGTLIGALIIQLLRFTLIAHNIQDGITRMVIAVAIVIAVLAQRQRAS